MRSSAAMTALVVPDPSCVLLVGAAGAGKSTFAARHFPPDAILSSDALRAAIGTGEADQAVSRTAFAALHRALDRRLAAGHLTVVDATNLTAAARSKILGIASRHAVPVVAIVLDLPSGVVHARNGARPGRRVPAAVVDRHLGLLRAAVDAGQLASEAYAMVAHVRDADALDDLEVRVVPGTPARPPRSGDAP